MEDNVMTVPFMPMQNINLELGFEVPITQQGYIQTNIEHDAKSLPSSVITGNLTKTTSQFALTMLIENSTVHHSGVYKASLRLNTAQYLSQFDCPNEYTQFVSYNDRAGIGSQITLDQLFIDLRYYGKYKHDVNMSYCNY